MAFLNNSGDIIVDAVLTDVGRQRLAQGLPIVSKFALGDYEIDYGLYNPLNSSGSAYYDLDILQTPVLEAFTNNASSMKSRLLSINRNNLLYLPVIKLNDIESNGNNTAIQSLVTNGYILAVDQDTQKYLTSGSLTYNSQNVNSKGILFGQYTAGGSFVKVDQGIDNSAIPS